MFTAALWLPPAVGLDVYGFNEHEAALLADDLDEEVYCQVHRQYIQQYMTVHLAVQLLKCLKHHTCCNKCLFASTVEQQTNMLVMVPFTRN